MNANPRDISFSSSSRERLKAGVDKLANSVLGDDKSGGSFINIVRITKKTTIKLRTVSTKENIKMAQHQRLTDTLNGSDGFFGIFSSKTKGIFEGILSLPDQMYIDNYGFKPEEVAKMKMIDKKGSCGFKPASDAA